MIPFPTQRQEETVWLTRMEEFLKDAPKELLPNIIGAAAAEYLNRCRRDNKGNGFAVTFCKSTFEASQTFADLQNQNLARK